MFINKLRLLLMGRLIIRLIISWQTKDRIQVYLMYDLLEKLTNIDHCPVAAEVRRHFLYINEQYTSSIWNNVKSQLDAIRQIYWCILSSTCFGYIRPSSGALDVKLQHMVFCTDFLDGCWFWEQLCRSYVWQWCTEGGLGVQPPPQIPKALQNHAKLNPIVKTVKNCWI